jgi:hypothetical protein
MALHGRDSAPKSFMVIREAPVFATPFDTVVASKHTPKYLLRVGDVVEATDRSLLSWVHVCSSGREGWVELFQTVVDEEDPRKQFARPHLISLDLLTHSRHGAVRPYGLSDDPPPLNSSIVSTCGHGLHLECWSNFLFTSLQRGQQQPQELSADEGEVCCPLCKTVANGILPYHFPLLATKEFDSNKCRTHLSLAAWKDQCGLLEGRVPSSDSAPAFDILVADNCLTKSQLLPKHDLSFGAPGEFRKRIISLRQLQALWSAVGYTLLSVTMALNNSNEPPLATASAMSKSSMLVVDQLLRCAQRASEWLSPDFDFRSAVLAPLQDLLFSAETCALKLPPKVALETLNQDAFSQLLALQPLPVVSEAISPEDSRVLKRSFQAVPSIGFNESHSLWPLLRQPLLSQDLHVIAIALASNCGDLGKALQISSLLCLARLCQILLEPCPTLSEPTRSTRGRECDVGQKRSRIPSDPAHSLFGVGELERFKFEICTAAGVACQGSVVEEAVQDSWVPFLRFISQLRSLLIYQSSLLNDPSMQMDSMTSISRPASIFPLLQTVGLGDLILDPNSLDQSISLACPLLREAGEVWGKQYRDYYDHESHPSEEESSSSLPSSLSAEQGAMVEQVPEAISSTPPDLEIQDSEYEEGDGEESEESDLDEDDIDGVDEELLELANDPALLLEGAEDVNMMDIREWLLGTGLAEDSEELQQVLNTFDRDLTRGSLLCGIDPVESPFRPFSDSLLLDAVPPLVGSVSGLRPFLDSSRQRRLSTTLCDDSHLGVSQRHRIRLYDLPEKYTDLYQMVSASPASLRLTRAGQVPFLSRWSENDREPRHMSRLRPDRVGWYTPPLLHLPAHLTAGNRLGVTSRLFLSGPGECTLHAVECGAGIGLFYLVEKCQSLLLSGPRAVYAPSIYLDDDGECSTGHSRPLLLSQSRLQHLQALYTNHEVAKEVIRTRLSERSIIRLNYY